MGAGAEEEAVLKLLDVTTVGLVPLMLSAAVKLGVMDILAQHAGPDGYMSAAQITAHFPEPLAASTSPLEAATSLDRLLRLLACHGLLVAAASSSRQSTTSYALNSLSRLLVQSSSLPSLAPYLLFNQYPAAFQTYSALHLSLLDGQNAFVKTHGTDMISYAQLNPSFNQLFNSAMASHSFLLMHSFLSTYKGFDNIASLVDIGGGIGASSSMIVSKHPHIKAINFDLPHVVANAPKYPGVEHVGGDMFQAIPKGDVIFMKWMLHGWDDVDCLKVLEKCRQALPNKGRVILVEYILPDDGESDINASLGYRMDIVMFANSTRGKERTKQELHNISKASGFLKLQIVCNVHGCSVVELYK